MFEYALAKGTVIQGGVMPGSDGERYQYRIDEVLGQGGFGITYKVSSRVKMGNIWLKERQSFAMKEHFVKGHCYRGVDGITMEYSQASAADVEDSLKDFLREGKRLAEICKGCPNIVDVNEVISANNTAYYIMEYIEGGDLRNYKGIDEEKAVDTICEVAKAVEHIHKQHVLHLDIKPENIVVGKNQEGKDIPVLIDFGVSRHYTKNGNLTTTHKDAMASRGFAPQEQFAGINKFSPEVDVYALAATLFYMLVGREPKSAFERIPNDVEKALPLSVSERTRAALVHALKVQAFERTKTVKEFVTELKTGKVNQTVEAEVLKDELVSGTILKGGFVDYQIVQVITQSDFYIEYKATRYVGSQYGGNATQKVNYTIYEYFLKRKHQCKEGSKIEQKYRGEETLKAFLKLAKQKTGLELGNNIHVADNSHTHEVFRANGTIYIVVKDSYDNDILKPKEYSNNKGIIIAASFIGLLVLLGVYYYTPTVWKDNSESLIADTTANNEYIDSINNDIIPEVELTQIVKEPEKEQAQKENETNMKTENPEPHPQPVAKVESHDEVFKRASREKDWDEMLSLARKGYEPACGAMAKHYVSSPASLENHCRAYHWAQKSPNRDKIYVIDVLTKYGFLVDGRPVTECNILNY